MTAPFKTEAEMCSHFIQHLPKGWTPYPETCGYDIVLVHDETGHQIAVEAKLRLNPKVVQQVMPGPDYTLNYAPDFLAVLVPETTAHNVLSDICKHLGITVIRVRNDERFKYNMFGPELPEFSLPEAKLYRWSVPDWFDCWTVERLTLPEVVPDVACGTPAPLQVTPWKIKAMKLLILLDKFGTVTRKDFRDLGLNPSLWTSSRWLVPASARGHWARCDNTPDYKSQHEKNYLELEGMIDDWMPDNRTADQTQGVLI